MEGDAGATPQPVQKAEGTTFPATASSHVYCVETSDPDVDLSRAIVTATPRNTPGSTLRVIPGDCAGGKGITIGSYNPDGNGLANSFYVAVH
ncbi:hypothetical protein ACFUN7_32340 [Streptomyces sp. NPDC057236]|uniref:hypothetical protein n=1 Tax=Streptomyces sp. NPDC057236 TaxID=3346059 RepID=UPI0036377CD2